MLRAMSLAASTSPFSKAASIAAINFLVLISYLIHARLETLVCFRRADSVQNKAEKTYFWGFEDMKANMGAGTALPNQSTISAEENMLSFFGRVNYTMMDKYLLTVTVRADGSSKFGDGNRWGHDTDT